MNSLNLIRKNLTRFETLDDLAIAVAQTAEQLQPEAQWLLLRYKPGTHPFSVLFSNSRRMPKAEELTADAFANWETFYTDDLKISGTAYLLLCSHPWVAEITDILNVWQELLAFTRRYEQILFQERETAFSNQFSQLLHDIESLIDLFQNPETDRETLLQRIRYQKHLNKRILFYNREVELLPMRLAVGDLLNACLQKQNLNIPPTAIDYIDLSPQTTVEVDAELFDQAFAEILHNALTATGRDVHKLHLQIRKRIDHFHFILKEWLVVSIIDRGSGIHPDFLQWVTMPYFTTWKKSGHTGFGLAIANKILRAHHGFLEIFSLHGSGTTVNMILPWSDDNAKE